MPFDKIDIVAEWEISIARYEGYQAQAIERIKKENESVAGWDQLIANLREKIKNYQENGKL